jgi:hypothetical protein
MALEQYFATCARKAASKLYFAQQMSVAGQSRAALNRRAPPSNHLPNYCKRDARATGANNKDMAANTEVHALTFGAYHKHSTSSARPWWPNKSRSFNLDRQVDALIVASVLYSQ